MTIRLTATAFSHARHSGAGQVARAHLPAVSLNIHPGEQVAIIGSSGAGKTTLLHLLATALRPHSGDLHLLGQNPWALPRRQRQQLRRRIGLIQQSPPLPPRQRVVTAVGSGKLGQWSTLKGLLNLLYPLDTAAISQYLRLLDIEDKLFARCDQLSGGQLQRVAIARTLYQQPELILADEPVAAMDPLLAAHTLTTLTRQARQTGATLVASLHAVELALGHFQRIIGLRDGRIVLDCLAAAVTPADLEALYANDQLTRQPSFSNADSSAQPLEKPVASGTTAGGHINTTRGVYGCR